MLRNIYRIVWMMAISIGATAQSAFTLEEAVAFGLKQSENMKLAQADIAIANAQIKEYKASGLPQVNGNVGYNYFLAIPTQIIPDFLGPAVDGRLLTYDLISPEQIAPPSGVGIPAQFGTRHFVNAGAEASFMIFDAAFFTGLKAISKAKSLAQRQQEQTAFQLRQNIIDAYTLVAYTQKNKEFVNKNIANLRATLNETKALFENGLVEELDVDRLELSLQNLETEEEKLERMAELAVNILKFQMNYPLYEDISLTQDMDDLVEELALSPQELGLDALNYMNRPEYNTILAGKTLNELQIENIRSGYYPSLRGFVSYATQLFRNDLFSSEENGWFPNSLVGVSLNVPIYDGNRRKAQIQQAKLELDKVNFQQSQFERGMELEVKNARETYYNAQATLQSRTKSLRLAERIYQTTQVKYKEGVGSTIETSQAERELYTAQSAYTEALYEVLSAGIDLKKSLGKL